MKKLPEKYTSKKNGLHIKYSPVNSAYFLMWHDSVLSIISDLDQVIAEYESIQGRPCWIEVRNHNTEDSDVIVKRIKDLLGGYFDESRGTEFEVINRGYKTQSVLKIYFCRATPSNEAAKILSDVEKFIESNIKSASFIEVSMEIP